MAENDWTYVTGGLDANSVDRGVTSGIPRPVGGGNFVFGMNSLVTTDGVVALYTNQANFVPMAKGGSVRGALQRGLSGGPLNFAPFLFIGLQGGAASDLAYLLGLGDSDPHRIVLRKGTIAGGLPDSAVSVPPTDGVLRKSTATFAVGTWVHLRLDMIVNTNGDVVLVCKQNLGNVAAPVWVDIDGMGAFIDDALQVNTGSAPLVSGRVGFGMKTKDVTRRCYVDQVECHRQL